VGFVLHWNRGMSFSLLNDVAYGPWILGAVAVLACAWFVHWLGQEESGTRNQERGWSLHQLGLGLLIGGALGNLLDRVVHGAVVDFLLVNPKWLFPYTFNPADAAITVGVVALLLDSMRRRG
jgi:signal peptidase II